MTFDNLSVDLQNIIMYNYDVKGRAILLFLIFSFSLTYLLYLRKTQKETAFLAVGMLRLIANVFSYASLILSPVYLMLYLHPKYTFTDMSMFFTLGLYVPILVFALAILGFDVFRVGFGALLEKVGVDTHDEKVKEFLKTLDKKIKWKK